MDCQINANGWFNANVSTLVAPFLLMADGTANDFSVQYYSYAPGKGKVNVNQLSHAALSIALEEDAASYYRDHPDADIPDIAEIKNHILMLNDLLSVSYSTLDLQDNFNFMYTDFNTDGTGFDLLLDRIDYFYSWADTYLMLYEKETLIPIYQQDFATDDIIMPPDPLFVTDILVTNHCAPYYQSMFVHTMIQMMYLWKDDLPRVDTNDFFEHATSLDFLNWLIVPKDRWSCIVPKKAFDDYAMNSAYVGLGFYIARDMANQLRICFVYPDSPAANAGLHRGDIIYEINGQPADDIHSQYDFIFGENVVGEPVDMTIKNELNETRTIKMTNSELKLVSNLYSTIIDRNSLSIGYLVFNNFVQSSIQELNTIFAYFKDNQVDDLILDLRYNSGGIIDIAQYLASLIAGDAVANQIFCQVQYNANNKGLNETYGFLSLKNSLNLSRLIVITTQASCSASEMVINGLEPYIDVIVIGNRTCGKPVGMNNYPFCDSYLFPIVFEVVNAHGVGDYYDGITVDCPAMDDISRPFGDINEASLNEALYYIENNACSKRKRKRPDLDESKPFQLHGFQQEIGAL
ncbi:MAG: peptidase [Candidatus Magnetoglobus multicellularis str. Araruama]|uniref:Peptidase n=1 Tax=Candidatus Magnetoglobus multicellularis str. Araruama TaxID=890399 RepID=A0A1V1PEK7_9BACT|nr:MAG: peptidase [Candidatus Magnetoglobus multicellularis str. Araruama]